MPLAQRAAPALVEPPVGAEGAVGDEGPPLVVLLNGLAQHHVGDPDGGLRGRRRRASLLPAAAAWRRGGSHWALARSCAGNRGVVTDWPWLDDGVTGN